MNIIDRYRTRQVAKAYKRVLVDFRNSDGWIVKDKLITERCLESRVDELENVWLGGNYSPTDTDDE
jgi:hypothetical protein